MPHSFVTVPTKKSTNYLQQAIALPKQSLTATAPTTSSQTNLHLSHLRSHNSSQRLEHLSAIGALLKTPSPTPIAIPAFLTALNQLILDPDNRVRAQVLKTYAILPSQEVGDEVEKMLPYIRAGMASLSPDIRSTSLDLLAWVLGTAGTSVVGCAGGWVKTLKSFAILLGWTVGKEEGDKGGWSREGKSSTGTLTDKILKTLAILLRAGLLPPKSEECAERSLYGQRRVPGFPIRNMEAHMLPTKPNAFGYLNLFGPPRDEEGEMYEDLEDRRRVFSTLGYEYAIKKGVEGLSKEGGELGRAAGSVKRVLREVDDGFKHQVAAVENSNP